MSYYNNGAFRFKVLNSPHNLFSVSLSKELVASSNINISGLTYNALAIPNRCLSPPESFLCFFTNHHEVPLYVILETQLIRFFYA